VGAEDVAALADLAEAKGIDLTVVGPEAPLVAGIADVFGERGLAVFGPSRDAARMEGSKHFAKQVMLEAGVPTGRAEVFTDFDAAVVSIGQEMAASILISLYLKEIGVKRIVVRAISDDHEKILKMIGVSDIIFPEKDMATRVGMMLSMKNTLDFLPLAKGYAIMEVNPPKSFIGKSLKDLAVSTRFGCYIIGLRLMSKATNIIGTNNVIDTIMAPPADTVIPEGYVLIVLGKVTDIDRIQSLD